MSSQTPLLNAYLQSNLDAKGFQIINLPSGGVGGPPTVLGTVTTGVWQATPIGSAFLVGTDIGKLGTVTQGTWNGSPIAGAFLVGTDITKLGTIGVGVWQGSVIGNAYLPTLDGIGLPVASLNANNQKIINLAVPTVGTDAANKSYVDGIGTGLQPKAAVAVASTADVGATPSGLLLMDGYQTVAGDRVLLKNQTNQTLNGAYNAATGAWARATDSATGAQLVNASYSVINGGQKGGTWFCNTPGPITIGTTNITFVLQTPPVQIDAILPAQAGQAGKYLTTSGSVSSWGAVLIDNLLPAQGANAGKFLSTNGTVSSWSMPLIDTILPAQAGKGGQFLTTSGTVSSWSPVSGVQGVINVKSPPYNAKGDGVTDDTTAIQSALNATGIRTIYFPSGTYMTGNLTVSQPLRMIGDGAGNTTLMQKATDGDYGTQFMLYVYPAAVGTRIEGLFFDGNSRNRNASKGFSAGIGLYADNCVVSHCTVYNYSWYGISVGVMVRNSLIEHCYSYLNEGGQAIIFGTGDAQNTVVRNCLFVCSGVGLQIGGGGTLADGNTFLHARKNEAGIFYSMPSNNPANMRNTRIVNNHFQNCGEGIESGIGYVVSQSGARLDGLIVAHNTFRECLVPFITGGVGETITGNQFVNCGGLDQAALRTATPQIYAYGGAGYAAGDILQVNGGVVAAGGFPALVRVRNTIGGGQIAYQSGTGNLQNLGTTMIYMGDYTTLPSATPTLTAVTGVGSGATCYYGNIIVQAGGTGYFVGDILQINQGTWERPAQARVEAVDANGAVLKVSVLSGGAYSVVPTSPVLALSLHGGSGCTLAIAACPVLLWNDNPQPGCGVQITYGASFLTISGNVFGNQGAVTSQNTGILSNAIGTYDTHDCVIANNIFQQIIDHDMSSFTGGYTYVGTPFTGTGFVIANNIHG